jgi:lysozyme
MNVSDDGIAQLEIREGSRNIAYRDTKGILTIGVGHTGPEVVEGLVWTNGQITTALRNDLDEVEQALNTYVLTPLTQNQFDALASFIFNVGVNSFKRSTMLKYINLRNFDAATLEFDRWHIPPEITDRRNSERDQFKEL